MDLPPLSQLSWEAQKECNQVIDYRGFYINLKHSDIVSKKNSRYGIRDVCLSIMTLPLKNTNLGNFFNLSASDFPPARWRECLPQRVAL